MQVNNARTSISRPRSSISPSRARRRTKWKPRSRSGSKSAIRGVNGVDEINSTVREGNSTTFVQFVLGTPTDRAVNDVRNAIAQIRGNLPDGILEPQITRVDIAGEPIMVMSPPRPPT